MTNLFFIRALFNNSDRIRGIIVSMPGCKTIDSKGNLATFTYNGLTTRIIYDMMSGEVNERGWRTILDKINGRTVFHAKQYADLELVQKVLNYSYDFANEKPIINATSSPKLSVYLNGNSDNLFDKLLDKQTAYTTFKSFVSHLHSISKRQNTNNKIGVKTIQYKETVSEGSPNPTYASYMDQKKQLLDEKRPLAEIIALLGPEPAKTLEPVVNREITSVDISERYCSFDNLYLRKEQDIVLYNVVDSFQNDKALMEELGIPNKLGILLHGLPGCGKTTTILTIASYFGRDVFYINLKSIKTNEELKAVFDHVNAKHVGGGIVVFEDIDAMTDATNKRTETVLEQSAWELVQETDKNNKNGGSGITLEYMLNLLDGMLTYNDSIVIITTNHLAKLDPALYRAGRMDKLIEMKKCDRYQISKIFRRFMLRDISQEVIERIEEDTYTPAEIIFHVKLYVKKRDETDETIMQPFMQ
jgi:SpoVK/Ycf46/Vps4 family AAA+-type ATPase